MTVLGRIRRNFGLKVDRYGGGAGTALLDSTYRGATVNVEGLDRVLLRFRFTKDQVTSLDVRCRDGSTDGDATVGAGTFPLLSQSVSHNSGAGEKKAVHNYTASTDDLLELYLGGAVRDLVIEAKATTGTPSGTDRVRVELVAVEG